MIVQIYEIGDPAEARKVSEAGVDHVGVLVGGGEFPRELSVEQAIPILQAIPQNSRKAVLTLSRSIAAIEVILAKLHPDIIHLGTIPEGLNPDHVCRLKSKYPAIQIMRSVPVIGPESIELAKQYEGIADFLLLDSHRFEDEQVGATGMTHDWSISRRIVDQVRTPVILAGGLGPENVAEAIRLVRPAGVDSKTRTDRTGTHRKDLEKVRRFIAEARLVF